MKDEDAASRDGRSRRWDAHRQARRAELVDAAILAIRRHGPSAGMGDIAAAAHTSKTVVYRHFADKGALYDAVCGRVAESILTGVRRSTTGSLDPRGMLTVGIDHYLGLIESDPSIYRFVVHPPAFDRRLEPDPLTNLVTLIGASVTEIIATGLRATGANTDVAPVMGHGLVGMVRAAADHWLDSGRPVSRAVLASQLAEIAWNGLAARLPKPRNPPTPRPRRGEP